MATRDDMAYTYNYLDKIFRYSIGVHGDYSGALYDGDFSMSLEQAQARKHAFIASELGITAGSRILDMGCGWGPFLRYAESLGASGVGVTLSDAQAIHCRRRGLDVFVMDCRELAPETFGLFDAVVSLGAFEHFCSIEDWLNGDQDAIYQRLFHTVASLLPPGGRFFLQTMVFGKNMIPFDAMDLSAPPETAAHLVAAMVAQFPGSWLPFGEAQIISAATPHFSLVSKSSGRLDYIETIRQWGRRFHQFGVKKYAYYASLLPKIVLSRRFRDQLRIARTGSIRQCFEREILDHFRFVFEKTG